MPGYPNPRVVGMLGNPNVQGYVLALAILVCLYMFKNEKKVSIVSSIILFVALLMTLSRGALVALVVGCVPLFISYIKDTRFATVKTLVGVVLLLLFYLAYQWMLENEAIYNAMMFRFQMLENPSEDESFVSRYDVWMNNLLYFSISPIVGVGLLPRDANLGADNEWFLFLRSFGVVGVVWLFIFLLAPIFLKKGNSSESKNLTHFVFSSVLLSTVFMIPAGVILSPVTFPFLLVLLSISDSTAFKINCMGAKPL
jgi:hypothetical protein